MSEDQTLLTREELVRLLRLDADRPGRAGDKLRTLIRRQHLPAIRRGRLLLFRRSEVEQWLNAPKSR